MRMLRPRELARAMGFPESFSLPSSATAAVKMIGNACPVGTVRALVRAAMAGAVQEAA
jgi:site-specific DNA-cytosine methylase